MTQEHSINQAFLVEVECLDGRHNLFGVCQTHLKNSEGTRTKILVSDDQNPRVRS